jgi:sugar (pentulose or hexulose) kinase
MSKDLILTVDVGTQSVRAIVFDQTGEQIASARVISKPYYSLQAGWAEVPAEQFWEDTRTVLRQVTEDLGDKVSNLAAITITANRDNILPLDKDKKPIRDWIVWMDTRRTPEAAERLKYDLKGGGRLIYLLKKDFLDMFAVRSKFNWFKYHEPETYENAKIYLSITGYLTYKLCGIFRDSYGMQVGYLPYDAKRMEWYNLPVIYDILGVRRDQLPELCAPGEQIGELTEKAAEECGLPAGLPLIASAGDKMCETLGSGVFSPKQATISYGTMATLGTTVTRYIEDPKLKFYTFPSCIPNAWNPEYNIYRGYWLVTWFCRQYAKESGFPEFLNHMNKEAEKIPPGSNGLFVFPFWTIQPGLYPHGKGMIVGWMDHHGPAHLYRAILESIAYALREGLELIERKSKTRIEKIFVVGGGSKSDVAMQLTADIFNIPCVRLSTSEVCAIGAAITAGVWAKMFFSFEEGVKQMVKEEQTFYPIPENVEAYNHIFDNVYKKIYNKNEDILTILEEYSKTSISL